MRLQDIPVGHIAKGCSSDLIVLVGQENGYYLNMDLGYVCRIDGFYDNYEDLGKLKIEVKETKQYKVNVSVV